MFLLNSLLENAILPVKDLFYTLWENDYAPYSGLENSLSINRSAHPSISTRWGK